MVAGSPRPSTSSASPQHWIARSNVRFSRPNPSARCSPALQAALAAADRRTTTPACPCPPTTLAAGKCAPSASAAPTPGTWGPSPAPPLFLCAASMAWTGRSCSIPATTKKSGTSALSSIRSCTRRPPRSNLGRQRTCLANCSDEGLSMHFLDLTLPTLTENLALDEALLLEAEEGGAEVLRLWEW